MKRYYYAKEITCPVCEGMGIILPYYRVKESDKKLINKPIIFEGEVCYVICKDVRRRG